MVKRKGLEGGKVKMGGKTRKRKEKGRDSERYRRNNMDRDLIGE